MQQSFDAFRPDDGGNTFGSGAPTATDIEIIGDSYIDLDTGDCYEFDGQAWVLIGTLFGGGGGGGMVYHSDEDTPITTSAASPVTWFSRTPGLPAGEYVIGAWMNYNVDRNAAEALVRLRVDGVIQTESRCGSLGSTSPTIRQPITIIEQVSLTPSSVIDVRLAQSGSAAGSAMASLYDGELVIWKSP